MHGHLAKVDATPVERRRHVLRGGLVGCLLWGALIHATAVDAQSVAATDVPAGPAQGLQRPLVVAIAETPPFAMKNQDGTWSGLSVDLWQEIASQLGIRWEPREAALEEIGGLLRDRSVDAGLGGIPVNAEGEIDHDFSQPYLTTGVGFAERANEELSSRAMIAALGSSSFLRLIMVIGAATLVVGVLITFIERRHDASEFGGPLQRGIATGVWWAAVTMTTVGYGDATPKTASGRSLALVWMFVGVAAVAFFTATVTSILTLSSLHSSVQHPADLAHLRLGAADGGAGSMYLGRRHMSFTSFEGTDAALAALGDGRVDAVVANVPALRYIISRRWQGIIRVSPIVLEPVSYAIGLQTGSPLREAINCTLLHIIEADRWHDVEQLYLGHS